MVDSGFWYGLSDVSDAYNDVAAEIFNRLNRRGLSFVDNIIRVMIMDNALKIDGLITFNTKDFADVCRNKIIIYDQYNLP